MAGDWCSLPLDTQILHGVPDPRLENSSHKEADLAKRARRRESPTQKLYPADNFSVAHHLGKTSDRPHGFVDKHNPTQVPKHVRTQVAQAVS